MIRHFVEKDTDKTGICKRRQKFSLVSFQLSWRWRGWDGGGVRGGGRRQENCLEMNERENSKGAWVAKWAGGICVERQRCFPERNFWKKNVAALTINSHCSFTPTFKKMSAHSLRKESISGSLCFWWKSEYRLFCPLGLNPCLSFIFYNNPKMNTRSLFDCCTSEVPLKLPFRSPPNQCIWHKGFWCIMIIN